MVEIERPSVCTASGHQGARQAVIPAFPLAPTFASFLLVQCANPRTQVYLRALNKLKAMEAVRDLSLGPRVSAQAVKAHTGFEPVPPP